MTATLTSDVDRLEAHEIPAEYSQKRMRAFVEKTRHAQGAELANAQTVFNLLCEALQVAAPSLKKAGADNPYCFEADVLDGKAARRMDVYKRGHFIFESKQGIAPWDPAAKEGFQTSTRGHSKNPKGAGVRDTSAWRDAMSSGRVQVGRYAVAVTKRGDPKPPFIVLADLGYRLWIWSSFSPDAADDYGDFEELAAFTWDQLAEPHVFRYLRTIFTEPQALDEDALGQRITAEIADLVSTLAVTLEKRAKGDAVGDFLMKCVFTMFAEDVGLLPKGLFSQRLDKWIADKQSGKPDTFVRGLRALWAKMDAGGDLDSGERLRQFNGYLFKQHEPIDLTLPELEALKLAAEANWRKVSPAIFGTLLERALTPAERHRLGAHYTPEPYIRRLVDRTMMAPLRQEWTLVRAEMELLQRTAKKPSEGKKKAASLGAAYRKKLATVRVLDPACGSGNFLYVALKELKRLEGEVERALVVVGGYQAPMDFQGESVHPVQFHGIEVKPWAAKIAELVLWIGYLQWQTSAGRLGRMQDPLIQDLHHIEARDALMTWKKKEPLLDESGVQVMRAVGVTDKKAERKMVPVERYVGVKQAAWPEVEYVVGNPPFLGNKRLMDVLGPGYIEAIKEAYPGVPGTADFVMWWWWRAAELVATGKVKAFGFVTTNSITQTFNRAVVTEAVDEKKLRLGYAIADHPWYDEGAAVRIAMTMATKEAGASVKGMVVDERKTKAAELEAVRVEERDVVAVHPDLSSGARVTEAVALRANEGLCFQGITLVGEGFRLSREEVVAYGYDPAALPGVLRPYLIGRDIVRRLEERYVIDFHGLADDEARRQHPKLFEHVVREVKPQRMQQNDAQRKAKWWLFGRSGTDLRNALKMLPSYIATSRTARHRLFATISAVTVPDTKLVAIALEGSEYLAALSSGVHLAWARSKSGFLGVGNDPTYNHSDIFETFPFPEMNPAVRTKLRALGESIEQHRRARQQEHPTLGLTDIYNVVVKLQRKAALTAEEETLADRALAHTLVDLHAQLDRAVLDAYGWPHEATDDELLGRLVTLNLERAAEEAAGKVRWLRPEFQAAGEAAQGALATAGAATGKKAAKVKAAGAAKWPTDLPGQIGAVLAAMTAAGEDVTTDAVAEGFSGATTEGVAMVLECLQVAQRVARVVEDDGSERWVLRA
jgi:hypothetical protein